MALGELACDSGRATEAETLARVAIEEFRREKEADDEISGESLLSRSLLQQGKLNQAQEAIAAALTLSKKSRDVTVRMPLEIQSAYVRAAAKISPEPKRLLEMCLQKPRSWNLFDSSSKPPSHWAR